MRHHAKENHVPVRPLAAGGGDAMLVVEVNFCKPQAAAAAS